MLTASGMLAAVKVAKQHLLAQMSPLFLCVEPPIVCSFFTAIVTHKKALLGYEWRKHEEQGQCVLISGRIYETTTTACDYIYLRG